MKNKQKLFGNVSGNQFRLLTESVETVNGADLVRGGLRKIFANGGKSISYARLEGVGFGYIKDISTAKRVALQESQELASEYGYEENPEAEAFEKPEPGDYPETETESDNEQTEVEIAEQILELASRIQDKELAEQIIALATQLIDMHNK